MTSVVVAGAMAPEFPGTVERIIVDCMVWPSDPSPRPPVVAGRFYPADPKACRAKAQGYLDQAPVSESSGKAWFGAVVPHAGWICSGAVAGRALTNLARSAGPVDLVVVFGAVHTPVPIGSAALDSHASWAFPTGDCHLPVELEKRLQEKGNLFAVDPRLHAYEHAVEVLVPMVQLAFPQALILPIEVPALDVAELVGRKTAEAVGEAGLKAVYLASSDLTHYGPNYRFAPAGAGEAAMQWAMDNDRPLLNAIQGLAADQIVPIVRKNHSACGAGAIAAMLAACRARGASAADILQHTSSYQTLAMVAPQPPVNSVGYAAVVVG